MKKLLTIIIILLSFNAYSSDQENLDQMSYEFTLNICDGSDIESKVLLFKQAFNEVIHFDIIDATVRESIKRKAPVIPVSKALSSLMNSRGFLKGLQACYGDNEFKKKILVISMISADISGKFAAGVVHVASYKMFSKAFNFLKLKSTKTYYSVLIASLGYSGHQATQTYSKIKEKQYEAAPPALKQAYDNLEAGKITEEQLGDDFLDNFLEQLDDENQMLDQVIVHLKK